MPNTLSVIICTSPGREEHLRCCLQQLRQQQIPGLEVLVVDDGSAQGEQVSHSFQSIFSLTYHWRPNDACLSRSRNIGAQQAHGEGLVFIDSDIVLNPQALFYYQDYLTSKLAESTLFYGYYGNIKDIFAPSFWFPDRMVYWADQRFSFEIASQHLVLKEQVKQESLRFAWGGNFALRQSIYQQIGGFNEAFIGWGDEDREFALRAALADYHLHFSMEVWGEHLVHGETERFYTYRTHPLLQRLKEQQLVELSLQLQKNQQLKHFHANPGAMQAFATAVLKHYLPHHWMGVNEEALKGIDSLI